MSHYTIRPIFEPNRIARRARLRAAREGVA